MTGTATIPRVEGHRLDVLGILEHHAPTHRRRAESSPMKLSAVSLITIPVIANVAEAMMWLVKEGTICRNMTRISEAPASRAAITNLHLSLHARERHDGMFTARST